jgi:hypothetical protein
MRHRVCAEGATAPETLRQKDRDSGKSGKWHDGVPADGIILSGNTTDGALNISFQELKDAPL